MTTTIPVLETGRLVIRPFEMGDLHAAHDVLSRAWGEPPEERALRLTDREQWLRWSVLNHQVLASLDQPAYGDRAVVLKEGDVLIGSVGLVPAMGPFRQIPSFPDADGSNLWFPEVGLYWAVDPAYRGRGYATEAARGLIDRGMEQFNLARIIATTEYSNAASIGVMRKLGMRIMRNPLPEPVWFQVVGVLCREE